MTDEDKNLLELAAKAAGFPAGWVIQGWNPLTDNGDALKLAVKLQLGISIPPVVDGRIEVVTFYGPIISIVEYPQNGNRNAATRRAIVRAAADVGKVMK